MLRAQKSSFLPSPRRLNSNHLADAEAMLDIQFQEVEELLGDLDLIRRARIEALIIEGQAKIEKEKHEKKLAELKREQELEKLRAECAKEQKRRDAELKEAQKQAELAQQRRLEKAKAAAEKEKLAKKKADQEKIAAQQAENKAREEASAKANAEIQLKNQEKAAAEARSSVIADSKSVGSNVKPHIVAEYANYMERIKWIKINVKDAMAAQPCEVKNQTMDIKLKLRPKFGMLTNSKSQLIQCRDGVREIVNSIKGDQLIYHWFLNLYAKMLVEQSESEANVKHQNALPLAMLTMLLWSEFPEFGDFVIPRFVKRCPQIIGYYCSINTVDARKKMGWKRDEDSGKYETAEQYMGRLSGICAVWACMTQTKLSAKVMQGNHPYPMSHSWTFLARTLNKPQEDVDNTDFALVAAWWDMTAMRFNEAFGKQAVKLLDVAWNVWTGDRTAPPAMRLRGLGENWKTSGKIEAAWKPLQP